MLKCFDSIDMILTFCVSSNCCMYNKCRSCTEILPRNAVKFLQTVIIDNQTTVLNVYLLHGCWIQRCLACQYDTCKLLITFRIFLIRWFHYSYPDFGEIALKPEIHWLDKYNNSIKAILPSKLIYFSYDILNSIMDRSKLKRYKSNRLMRSSA